MQTIYTYTSMTRIDYENCHCALIAIPYRDPVATRPKVDTI